MTPQLVPQPWNRNLPFQVSREGNAAAKCVVRWGFNWVTTEPVTKQNAGAPSPSALAGISRTPLDVCSLGSGGSIAPPDPKVIPLGAIFWIAANVHGPFAASARVGQTEKAATAMMRVDHPASTRCCLGPFNVVSSIRPLRDGLNINLK
jgi:hypothetical protein